MPKYLGTFVAFDVAGTTALMKEAHFQAMQATWALAQEAGLGRDALDVIVPKCCPNLNELETKMLVEYCHQQLLEANEKHEQKLRESEAGGDTAGEVNKAAA